MITPDYNKYENRANLWAVKKATKRQILELLAPVFLGLGFIIKVIYSVVFAWWLDPLLRRTANRRLVSEIKMAVPFLISDARSITVVQSDWPEVKISYGNLLFTIAQFRGDITVSVAPSHAPRESYELGPVIAAIDNRHFSERDIINDLVDAEHLLRPRLQKLNDAFSEPEYARIRARL